LYECVFHNDAAALKYHSLRNISNSVLMSCSKLIYETANSLFDSKILFSDAGAGTGRLVNPLVNYCCRENKEYCISALDVSEYMLENMMRQYDFSDKMVVPIVCDLRQPFPIDKNSQHLVYTLATLHILDEWRCAVDNIREVICESGYFMVFKENNQFMHQTEGFDKDYEFSSIDKSLSDFMIQYHFLRKKYGHPYIPFEIRYSDMDVLFEYCTSHGFRLDSSTVEDDRLKWQKPHTYNEMMYCFKNRQMTTFGSELPDDVRRLIADDLDQWLLKNHYNLDEVFYLQAELIPYIFQKESSMNS
jgi:SAM-dependent methyltransferase